MPSPSEEIALVAVRHYPGHSPLFILRGWCGGQLCCRGQCSHQLWIRRLGALSQGQGVAVSWPSTPPRQLCTQACHLRLSTPGRNREKNLADNSGANNLQVCPTNLAVSYNTGTCSGLLHAGVDTPLKQAHTACRDSITCSRRVLNYLTRGKTTWATEALGKI